MTEGNKDFDTDEDDDEDDEDYEEEEDSEDETFDEVENEASTTQSTQQTAHLKKQPNKVEAASKKKLKRLSLAQAKNLLKDSRR